MCVFVEEMNIDGKQFNQDWIYWNGNENNKKQKVDLYWLLIYRLLNVVHIHLLSIFIVRPTNGTTATTIILSNLALFYAPESL